MRLGSLRRLSRLPRFLSRLLRFLPSRPRLALAAGFLGLALLGPALEGLGTWFSEPVRDDPEVVQGDRFALDVFRALAAERKGGNVVFSPAALEDALRRLRVGARGETRKALDALPFAAGDARAPHGLLSIPALLADEELADEELTDEPAPVPVAVLRAPLRRDPAGAARRVNQWGARQTGGGFHEFLDPKCLQGAERIAFHLVCLRADWLQPFDVRQTRQEDWIWASGGKSKRPFMHRTGKFRRAEGEDWEAVAIPFRSRAFRRGAGCFIAILPKDGKKVREFAGNLSLERYDAIRLALASAEPRELALALPRIRPFDMRLSCKGALSRCGLAQVFAEDADRDGFADGSRGLSQLVQCARCSVREEGARPSAAGPRHPQKSAPREDLEPAAPAARSFRLDRAFVWAIDGLAGGDPPSFLGLCVDP